MALHGLLVFSRSQIFSKLICRGPVAGLVKQEFVENILIEKQTSVNHTINTYAGAQIELQQ